MRTLTQIVVRPLRVNKSVFSVAAVFERLRNVLHSGEIDKRVQYMIEVMFAIRKDGFKVFQVKDLCPEG